MKKIKNYIIGLAMVALPAAGYFAPQYAALIPVAESVLEYLMGDNATELVRE